MCMCVCVGHKRSFKLPPNFTVNGRTHRTLSLRNNNFMTAQKMNEFHVQITHLYLARVRFRSRSSDAHTNVNTQIHQNRHNLHKIIWHRFEARMFVRLVTQKSLASNAQFCPFDVACLGNGCALLHAMQLEKSSSFTYNICLCWLVICTVVSFHLFALYAYNDTHSQLRRVWFAFVFTFCHRFAVLCVVFVVNMSVDWTKYYVNSY